jgi:hypothetical protein
MDFEFSSKGLLTMKRFLLLNEAKSVENEMNLKLPEAPIDKLCD